jgi:hypothetical protein
VTDRTPTRSATEEGERAADGVNPTARWFFRGVWKFAATVALTLLAIWLVGLVVRAFSGSDVGGGIYP